MTNQNFDHTEPFSNIEPITSEEYPMEPMAPTHKDDQVEITGLPEILRKGGALTLVAGAAVFLLQGWDRLAHLERYYSFLGVTIVVVIAALFCGLKVKEDRSSRTLFAITLGLIPIHFAQLGALLFSVFPGAHMLNPENYGSFFWEAPSTTLALITIGVGILCLLPIAFSAFSVLIRGAAKETTVFFIAMNSILLIPIRNADLVGIIVGLAVGLIIIFDQKVFRKKYQYRTRESFLSRASLFLPLTLMIGRQLYLYQPTELFIATLYAMVGGVLFLGAPHYIKENSNITFAQFTGLLFGTLAITTVTTQCLDAFPFLSDWKTFLYGASLSSLYISASTRVRGGSALLKIAGAFLLTYTSTLHFLSVESVLASFLAGGIAFGVLLYGYWLGFRSVITIGAAGLFVLLLSHIGLAFDLVAYSPWVSLTALGIIAIILSSYLERNGQELLGKITRFKKDLDARAERNREFEALRKDVDSDELLGEA